MNDVVDTTEQAIKAVEKLRREISHSKTKQVASINEKNLIKAASFAWFKTYSLPLRNYSETVSLNELDNSFSMLSEWADRVIIRSRYKKHLGAIKEQLVSLRSSVLLCPVQNVHFSGENGMPEFSSLVADPRMRDILIRRWREIWVCIDSEALLASIVLVGSLLEALLIARVNKEQDKKKIVGAKCAPKDKTTGKTKPFQEWTLSSYIDVAHELGWIGKASRDIGIVLRDYRNYVHPEKEYSHGEVLTPSQCRMFGDILRSLSTEILAS